MGAGDGRGRAARPDKGPGELFFRGQLHPLNVTLLDDGSRLWGHLTYKTDFYDAQTIQRLADGLEALLAAVSDDPRLRVSELPVAPGAERGAQATTQDGPPPGGATT